MTQGAKVKRLIRRGRILRRINEALTDRRVDDVDALCRRLNIDVWKRIATLSDAGRAALFDMHPGWRTVWESKRT
jgi:hypothetical protein